jgi:DNA replication and repair protein RecF
MQIHQLTLSHFRNVSFAALGFSGRRQFLVGRNGQGKSNLLEAAGYITALRSFRTTDSQHLIRREEPEAAIACDLEREDSGTERVTVKIRRDGKELWTGGERVTRLADHIGRFPTVVFSSQDLQLIRGAPMLRRRWLDLTLSAMDPVYLDCLQTYNRALAGRNSLLRRPDAGMARELPAFDRTLAPSGARLVALRGEGIAALGPEMAAAYERLCGDSETATLRYEAARGGGSSAELLAVLEAGRARDLQAGTTLAGPHRDDIGFVVRGMDAKDFASEGQQRSTMLALRLAQAGWFRKRSRVRPVLLADDVLGELDPERRRQFWGAVDPESQVIATGTQPPDPAHGPWQVFTVAEGAFTRETRGMGAAD